MSFAATVAHLQLGITAYWSGEAAAAVRPLSEAVRMARRSGNVLAETYGLGYLALVAADGGDLEDAARRVPLGLELCADPGVAEHFVATLPHLARATLLAASGPTAGGRGGSDACAGAGRPRGRPPRAGARTGHRRKDDGRRTGRAAPAGRGPPYRPLLPRPRLVAAAAGADPHR